ncbi:MAG: alkyl hydroperoxide reductase [Gammaproteobacteria bacterium RBG_16_51_14]|nr:MAG: alkyl hydroperoxide reductase [Gammaproteobacteria bacterium RBG_16_51_14]
MALTETPVCDFGQKAPDFTLPGIDGKHWSLNDCQGENGTLIMFICNHCPYVKAIQARLVQTARELMGYGIGSVGIMPNDPTDYPEDSFENMQKIAGDFDYPFPYLYDEFQTVAKSYGAVCTPDFFGYNANLELQYRGRFDASRMQAAAAGANRDLFEAMVGIAGTGEGPGQQIHGMGCSIKWRP